MCAHAHPYGTVVATRTLKTDYGTYHVCQSCAEAMAEGGYVRSDFPLLWAGDVPPMCQCEHADHVEDKAVR